MIYKMTLKDSADEMTFDLLEVPIVGKDIEGAVDNVTLDGNQYTDYLWLKKQFIQKWSILCDDEYTRLRGFYTRQFENADVPSYRLYYGDDIIRNSTLSGERIELSISGVADGTISLAQIDGNIEQTTYTGKNLLNITDKTSTTNGITRTAKDGKLTFSGTASAYTQGFYETPNITANEPMILSANRASLSGVTIKLTVERGGSNIYPDLVTTYQLQTGDILKQIYFIIANGATTSGSISPQLEKGSTATTYEPYVGGIPAPNPNYPQPIETVTGRQTVTVTKNLFNPTATPWGSKVAYNSSGTQVWWDGYYGIIEYQPVQPNTQYTFSNSAGKPILYGLVFYDANKTMLSTVPSATTTFTTPANCAYIRFAIQNGSAPTWTQLELGNQSSAYEPYEAQEYEINLGKNLLNSAGGFTNKIINSAGGESNSNPSALFDGYIAVAPSTQYTLSFKTSVNSMCVATYKADKTFITRNIKNNASDYTLTTSADTHFVRIYFNYDNSTTVSQTIIDGLDIQLERGSTASSYSAYFTPIELCKIGTYQDRIYKENGKWWLHKEIGKVVLTGNETIGKGGTTQNQYFYANVLSNYVKPSGNDQLVPHFSNRFVSKTPNQLSGGSVVGSAIRTDNAVGFAFGVNSEINTIDKCKTWLASNNVTVYYVLATPTTTEITNEAVLEGLEALQDEAISVGQHNIYTDTPNALPTLTFDLTEYLSKSTTIIPETAVRLTLTDGGVINACGCRKDVQLTMRETIE